jgi:signal transduction protein with GAF and PtsI domain
MAKLSFKEQLKEKDRQIELLHAISRIVVETRDLEDLLQKFSDMIVRELEADSTLIYLHDQAGENLVLCGSHNPHPRQLGQITLKVGEGITGWVAEKMQPVAISKNAFRDPRFKFFNKLEEDRYEAFLSVPIAAKDKLIGVLNVQHRKAHVHDETELALARTIANEIAGAIEHAQLFDQTRKQSLQIGALARMSQSIAQGIYLQEILQLIVKMTAEMMESQICSLMLLDKKGQELKIEATQSLSDTYRSKPPVKVTGSVSGRAILTRKPVVVRDVTIDPQYMYPDIARKENLKSMLIVPMITKEKPIGVINCYTSRTHDFTPGEVELIQAVANQAAIAIEHTQAIEKAMEAQEALESRKIIERAKGIIMRRQGLSEDSAFRLLQRQAMDRRKSMKEIAEAVILSEDIQKTKNNS